MKKLDVLKILAERNERRKLQLELNGIPSVSNDSLPTAPNFSDSILNESSCQSVLSQSSTEKKLDSFTVLDIFDKTQVFRLFSEDEVNFSWLEKGLSVDDVPKMCPLDLVHYLRSELKAKHLRRSTNTIKQTCRYLFFLMSVTTSDDVMEECLRILKDKISDPTHPFCIEVPDLLLVLMNYGTVISKLWPKPGDISYSRAHRKFSVNSFDSKIKHSFIFPRMNLEKVLSLLRLSVITYPCFTESEKIGLCNVMLNLSMAYYIAGDTFLTLTIKNIISHILESFTVEEWSEINFKMVEELVVQCWDEELEATAMVQRITCIPRTTGRGMMFQQSASYFAIQHLMDLEEIDVSGRVSVEDVYRLVDLLSHQNLKNYQTLYSIVMLLDFTLDVNDQSSKKEEMKKLYIKLNEVRHRIKDISDNLDTAPMLVKDLMCELSLIWKNSIPIDNVV